MAQKCPNCKRAYTQDDVYCEDCGEPLVPGGPAWRKLAILGFGAVLVVAAVWGALGYVESNVRENVTVVSIGTPKFDGNLASIPINISNASIIDLNVDSVTCQAAFAGVEATCNMAPMPLPKGKPRAATLVVQVSGTDSGNALVIPTATVHVRALGIPVGSPVLNAESLFSGLQSWINGRFHQVQPNSGGENSAPLASNTTVSTSRIPKQSHSTKGEGGKEKQGTGDSDWNGSVDPDHRQDQASRSNALQKAKDDVCKELNLPKPCKKGDK